MIQLFNVTKYIKDRCLLDCVNIKINKGDFVVITGPSGEGKTTLLNIMGFLDDEFTGSILFNGVKISADIKNDYFEIRKKIGYVFQNSLVNDSQSVYRNMTLPSLIIPVPEVNERVRYLLKKTGLSGFENKNANILSGGEKQRLSIARAIIHSPVLMLADEPTASLDHDNKIRVIKLLESINAEYNLTVIVVTHDLDYFKDKRKIILKNGILYED
ncbi:ABC transporter ATP-binding protein [Salmonella enterica]|nr:ABC transporter ATP-binding protein [Salmonella enterica]ECC3466076.1 ABC transporter ATP-binding protein [Salmonella enterica subsp. enterica]ECG1721483.1 ABC transporter ATP-binding protein [Salmonella enterica subsp. diarizonae serovar 17:z10:e,n,x,z15]ECI0980677.1 ABC transporter ATP-binding protein [Salmonella enterica subsp. enterica serovar Newport]ECI2309963.1 ABC transporter ATP-binding protein [Salmonella enterica subsp. enterica serovar Infantis]